MVGEYILILFSFGVVLSVLRPPTTDDDAIVGSFYDDTKTMKKSTTIMPIMMERKKIFLVSNMKQTLTWPVFQTKSFR